MGNTSANRKTLQALINLKTTSNAQFRAVMDFKRGSALNETNITYVFTP
jgi:hypothetical protein